MAMALASPSRVALDAAPGRTLNFLIGVNTSIEARAALMACGYTQSEHDQMWSLIGRLTALPTATKPLDTKVMGALAELNAWDEPNLPVIRTILERKFAEQAEFVGQGLEPSPVAAQAALNVATVLDRFDLLESSPDRKATRKQDHAALERLAERGYTKEERKRLRALVITAQTVTDVEPISRAESDAIKAELLGFLNEWTTQAKAVIKRRDILIRLGIGKRQKRAAAAADPTPAPVPVAPAPNPITPPVVVAPAPPIATPPVTTAPATPPQPSPSPPGNAPAPPASNAAPTAPDPSTAAST